jgi:hypothetical protein
LEVVALALLPVDNLACVATSGGVPTTVIFSIGTGSYGKLRFALRAKFQIGPGM